LPKTYIEEKTVSSINDVEKTGYLHVEDWKWTPISMELGERGKGKENDKASVKS
jgi:hypothetical protein